jgi:outer membrane receptor protein involved in Fe transport
VKHTTTFGRAFRTALLSTAVVAFAVPAMAQQQAASDDKLEEIVVTGSRIARANDVSTSPIAVVSFEELTSKSDVTLESYLNTLPQITPSGTSTSNNPPNAGQSNISLRGLGANRNLVLIDGRRPMVSDSEQRVDVNTIPQALIESIEVVTGGAGATYGADAVSGVVNMKLKKDFEGVNLRATYSNSTEPWDAEEYQFEGVIGGNFGGDKGNAVMAFDYVNREGMVKGQRDFAGTASATTTRLPEGLYAPATNAPTQAAVDSVFARYGVAAGAVPASLGLITFNTDGTLASIGVFNSPINVQNFKYPIDSNVNANFYPDLYSYNFDIVNILVSPLERRSFMAKTDYDITDNIEMFASVGWTRYFAASALAPTPMPTARIENTAGRDATRVKSPLVSLTGAPSGVSGNLVIPVTNPFIPADLRTILNSRTGDNTQLVGSGATEPFLLGTRALWAGLRQNSYINEVVQYMAGFKGDITDDVRFEVYASEGRTTIDQSQTGNVDGQKLQTLLEAADGGASICQGGYNPFGRQPVSAACAAYLDAGAIRIANDFKQRVANGYISADLAELPAGDFTMVFGAEHRAFQYRLRPGAAAGPIHGFTTSVPAGGNNRFNDFFTEAYIPLVKGADFAQSLDLSLGYRYSNAKYTDTITPANNVPDRAKKDDTYKIELTWQPLDTLRGRASYQRAARAPNFGELFDGGGSAPQIFDPCSLGTAFRNGQAGATAAQATALCAATGLGAGAAQFVAAPGGQTSIDTAGNVFLNSEKADTISFGAVFNTGSSDRWLERLNGSLDYYSIKIKDPILVVDPNLLIADCYNFFGNNASYSATQSSCAGLVRAPTILGINDPSTGGAFPGRNLGKLQTSGIDLQLNYGFDLEWMGAPSNWGDLKFNLFVTRLLDWKRQDLANLPNIDYAGTVTFFGALGGLDDGTSLPTWRANLNTTWTVGDFSFDVRTRYIDAMKHRLNVMFPGENIAGVGDVWYWDLAATWDATDYATLRVGVNNVADRQPPVYSPNVQSGTDPSLYDVIGRRVFFQTNLKF